VQEVFMKPLVAPISPTSLSWLADQLLDMHYPHSQCTREYTWRKSG